MDLNSAQISGDFHSEVNGEVTLNDRAIALNPERQWAARIRPHLEAGVAGYIAAGLEAIQAKSALKKQRGASFIHMVQTELGESVDAVEKWMAIARNPYLADSANLRNLPTAWTTLYVLCSLKPQVLEELVETGRLNPALTGAAAAALVRTVRGRNDRCHEDDLGGDHDRDGGADHDGTDRDRGKHTDVDGDVVGGVKADVNANGDTDAADQEVENSPPAQTASRDDTIGSDSRGELERKLARLEELERETRRQAIQLAGYESEIEELKAENAALRVRLETAQGAAPTNSKIAADTITAGDSGPIPDFLQRKPKATGAPDSCTGIPLKDAVATAFNELGAIGSECRNQVENAPENLSQSQRFEILDNTAAIFETLSAPTIPAELASLKVVLFKHPKPRSRSDRRDVALDNLAACMEALDTIDESDPRHQAAHVLRNMLEDAWSEAGECEFPGSVKKKS